MLKKQYAVRVAATALILIMLMSFFSPLASANADRISVSADRYLTDELLFNNCDPRIDVDGIVSFSFNSADPSVTLTRIDSARLPAENNSLRIVVDNASQCDQMVVEVELLSPDGTLVKTDEKTVDIVKGNGAHEYIVHFDDISYARSVTLRFKGGEQGTITLISVGTVSYYHDVRNYSGALSLAEYDTVEKIASIQGSVSWECVSAYPDAKVVVYKLSQAQTAEDITDVNSYMASTDISLNFNISMNLQKNMYAYAQYVVAVLTADGTVIPLAPEFYLSFKNESETIDRQAAFKGVETLMYGGAIECGSGVAYVEVNLGRLFSNNENGYQYVVDGAEYYIDKDYVSEIDDIVNAYRTAGVDVYFRLLIDEECQEELYSTVDSSGDAKYYAINIYDGRAFSKFVIYTEYLISRYVGTADSNIRGLVLGRSIDKAAEYNYFEEAMTLQEYSKKLAKTCAILRNVLDKYGNGLELVVPISDGDCGVYNLLSTKTVNGEYPLDILMASMLEYAKGCQTDITNLHFMLESDAAPISQNQLEASANVREAIEKCIAFETVIFNLHDKFSTIPERFIYCWYASDDDISDNYIYNYNVAVSTRSVRAFAVSLADVSLPESEAFFALSTTYKYADTDKNREVGRDAISKLGFASWKALLDNYGDDMAVKRDLVNAELKNSVPSHVIGSYKMYDYERGANATGWESLSCNRIAIGTAESDNNKTLMFSVSRGEANEIGATYGSAVYKHENLMKVSGISGLSFNLFVPESEVEKIYEVVISIESEGSVTEFSGVVFSGSDATLYADIENVDVVKSIKISTRELSASTDDVYRIYLRNISIHSSEYNDVALERMVVSGGIVEAPVADDTLRLEEAKNVMFLIVGASIAFIWMIWLIKKLRKKI